jgi:lipopolysaccharide/colanic/teichoic acid biosynthesis glycosyltransferase
LVRSFLRPTKKLPTLLIAQNDEYNELKTVVNQHDFYPFYFTDHLEVTEADVDTGNTLETLKRILEENGIQQVIVDIRDQTLTPLLPYLYNLASQRKIDVFDAAKVYQDLLKKMPINGIGHFWFFESVQLDTHAYEVSKRVLDVVLTIPWLFAWLILHPFIALAIRLDSKGSVFITQERYGLGGRVMKLYKYRTMERSDDGKWFKDKDQTNRVTRVGKFLRKTSLDEFPQFLSILKGDISFIGPRPDMLPLGGRLSAQIPFYMMRYSIRPGLSGWAQVTQSVIPQTVEDNKVRFQYDLYYIKHRSLLMDLIIIIRTCKALIMRITM